MCYAEFVKCIKDRMICRAYFTHLYILISQLKYIFYRNPKDPTEKCKLILDIG